MYYFRNVETVPYWPVPKQGGELEIELRALPASICRCAGNLASLFGSEALGSGSATFQPAHLMFGWMALRFAHCIVCFADGNVEYLFGKLGGIARTFGHGLSIAQPAP